MIKAIVTLLSLIILSSCASSHQDVRPGVNNQHSVTVQTESKQKGAREALTQANNYCKSLNKHAAIVSEDHTFSNPDMDEQTYNNSQKIKDVATVLLGGSGKANRANHAASQALGKSYTTKMTFQCN